MMNLPNTILAVDVETTGLVPNYDFITSICCVVMEDGQPTGEMFERRVMPGEKCKLSLEALAVQGVDFRTPEGLEALGAQFRALFPESAVTAKHCMAELAEWSTSGGYNKLPNVAHMASFDWPFIVHKLEINRSAHSGNALSPMWICTKSLACHVWPDKNSKALDSVLVALGLPKRATAAHNAKEDALNCGYAYFGLKAILEGANGN